MVGERRSLRRVVGVGQPSIQPILGSETVPTTAARRLILQSSGDKPSEGVGGRGKKRRLARWSLPERISYFHTPRPPFSNPCRSLVSFFVPSSFSSDFPSFPSDLSPLASAIGLYFIFSIFYLAPTPPAPFPSIFLFLPSLLSNPPKPFLTVDNL